MILNRAAESAKNLAEAIEAMVDAWEELYEKLFRFAEQTQEEIDHRKAERAQWGYPPKKLIAAYKEPVKKIRPCARSFGRRR